MEQEEDADKEKPGESEGDTNNIVLDADVTVKKETEF